VIADETRPFLQGARLTAWEMVQENIPVTLISDNMSGHLMSHGEIDAIVLALIGWLVMAMWLTRLALTWWQF